jgi:transcriptional regulator with XRE-family HTH domain
MRLGLKFAIVVAGKTQRQVAAETRLSENRLSEIVCGWANPRQDEKEALARALNQSAATLFDNSRPRKVAAATPDAAGE